MIDPGTAQHSPNAGRRPEKLCLRHLAARANPRSNPFGLAWRAGTEQGRLRKPASGESRFLPLAAAWILGNLSSKYETGGRGRCRAVSVMLVSYGSYQMTSQPAGGTVARFVAEQIFPWRQQFAGLTPGSPEFSARWRALANEARDAFFEAQHAFVRRTHFDPLARKIEAENGLKVTLHSQALQDVIWSTAVQHGPNTPVVHRAIVALGGGEMLLPADLQRDRRLIVAIYAERGRRNADGNLVYFSKNSKAVQDGVARRFVDEERDALRMLESHV